MLLAVRRRMTTRKKIGKMAALFRGCWARNDLRRCHRKTSVDPP
jgi:hypothetical protein